jgi:hypothetical protein
LLLKKRSTFTGEEIWFAAGRGPQITQTLDCSMNMSFTN